MFDAARTESPDSLREKCHFPVFCPNLRDESVDSLRAPRTHPFFVEFCPIQRDESMDSLRPMCQFADFCPNLRDELVDSLRSRWQFPDFCPNLREAGMSGLEKRNARNTCDAVPTGFPADRAACAGGGAILPGPRRMFCAGARRCGGRGLPGIRQGPSRRPARAPHRPCACRGN
jgi:hypothetical protein